MKKLVFFDFFSYKITNMKQNVKYVFGMMIFIVRIWGTYQGHTTKTATEIKFLGMESFVTKIE